MARTSIIVTSGRRSAVAASVTSALDQTDADLEIVVVETGGEGGGEPELGADDARVRRLACDDLDFATQANRGLATVRSPLVKLLPAGDRLAPGCLAAQVAALDARCDVGVVFAAVECVDEAGRPLALDPAFETPARTGEELLPLLLGSLRLAPAAALARRELLLEAGGLDPLYTRASAHDLWLRALASNAAVVLADRLARVRPVAEDAVERSERGLAALRALSRSGTARFLAGLGGGVDRPEGEQAAARLALVDAILASGNEVLLPVVPGLVAEARALGARVGSARTERLAAAGLRGVASRSAAGREELARDGGFARRAHTRAEIGAVGRAVMLDATSSAGPVERPAAEAWAGDSLHGLRERRRLFDGLASEVASERDAASRMALLVERVRRRVADVARVGGDAVPAMEPLVAQIRGVGALAEQVSGKLRIAKRLHGAVDPEAAARVATSADTARRDGGTSE
jgi:hypothetical protein